MRKRSFTRNVAKKTQGVAKFLGRGVKHLATSTKRGKSLAESMGMSTKTATKLRNSPFIFPEKYIANKITNRRRTR